MVQYQGQFTMHLPTEQLYLPNGYTGANGRGVSANGVSTHTPSQQPQYQPTTPQSIPRHLPRAMINSHGQQFPSPPNQTTGSTSPSKGTRPHVGQSYGYMNSSPSSYTISYGNPAQSYQYKISSNIDFDTPVAYQSAQHIASQAQVRDISGKPQVPQTPHMSANVQNETIAMQYRQLQQAQQKMQMQISHQRQAAQLQAMQEQTAPQQAPKSHPTMPGHNNAATQEFQYRVSSGHSQTAQATRPSNSRQPSSATNRSSPKTLPPSPPKVGVEQHMTSKTKSPYSNPRTPTVGHVTPVLEQSPPKSGQKSRPNVKPGQMPATSHQQSSSFAGKAARQPNQARFMDPLEQRTPRVNSQGGRKLVKSSPPSLKDIHQHNAVPNITVNGEKNNPVISLSPQSLNGINHRTSSAIESGSTQRNSSLMSSSSPANGRQQQTCPTNFNPAINVSHMPALNTKVGLSPSQMQGKKRPATDTPNGNGPEGKKQAIEGHNVQQGPTRDETQTALDKLRALQAQQLYQVRFSPQQAEQHAKLRKAQDEQRAKTEKEQQERDAKIRKEQEERDAKWRQEQEELQKEHQRLVNLRLERERLEARKKELRSDPSSLYRYYDEYMKHFPADKGSGRNPYLWRLLANQRMPIDTTTETAIAIAFAKQNWDWFMEYPKDVQRAYKEATKGKAPKRK